MTTVTQKFATFQQSVQVTTSKHLILHFLNLKCYAWMLKLILKMNLKYKNCTWRLMQK